jgi:uncharacterized surface protein with fasciclin (FAS1) repeats
MKGTAVKLHDIVETLRADGAFSILVKCIRATDMVKFLADRDRSYTLFAPNDAAFKKLTNRGQLHHLLDDKERLTRLVNYHILTRIVRPEHFDGRKQLMTREGSRILLDVASGFRVNNATVICPDIECSNGVVHEIDAVLLLPGQGLRKEY